MPEETPRYDFDRVFRLLLTVGTLIATVWLLSYLSDVLVPFAVAVLLAYLLNPIVNAFEHKTGRRGVAVGLTLAIFAIAFLVVVPLLASVIYAEVTDVSEVFAKKEIKAKIVETIEVQVDPDDPLAGTGFFEGTTEEKTVERDAFQLGIFPTPAGLIDKHLVSVATILAPVWSLIGIGVWRQRRSRNRESFRRP